MEQGPDSSVADPWAWARAAQEEPAPDPSAFAIAAIVIGDSDPEPVPGPLETVGTADPSTALTTVAALAPDVEWLWFLTPEVVGADASLAGLLNELVEHPEAEILGPAVVREQRRGAGDLIVAQGWTLGRSGRLVALADAGEIDQGQLRTQEVLGLSVEGLMIRRSLFVALGGFAPGLVQRYAGVELGWMANLAGKPVIASGTARIRLRPVGTPSRQERVETRAQGMALASAEFGHSVAILLGGIVRSLGLLLGKAAGSARNELAALFVWPRKKALTRELTSRRGRAAALGSAQADLQPLLPARGHWISVAGDAIGTRFSDWTSTFAIREAAPEAGLDDLTGDDFANSSRRVRRKISPVLVGVAALFVASLVALRSQLGIGTLMGPQLLPAPASWQALLASAVSPVAGQPGVNGAPWVGVLGWSSLLTLGQVDWLVTLIVVGCVPVTWLVSLRLLQLISGERRLALVGATLFALTPVLVGALGAGQLGTLLWAVLLPNAAYTVLRWAQADSPQWRNASRVALIITLVTLVVPLGWVLALAAVAVAVVRRRRLAVQGLVIVLFPVAAVLAMSGTTYLRYPGRLLTTLDPSLAPLGVPIPWQLAFGITPEVALPPLWLSLTFFSALWLFALVAGLRRAWKPVTGTLVALLGLALALGVTRPTVLVAPGVVVRPQAGPWLILMAAGLVVAGVLGAAGVLDRLAASSLGAGQLLSLGATITVAAVTVLGAGWWIWAGAGQLERSSVGTLPPFVRQAATSGTARVLILDGPAPLRWSIVDGDYLRIGDAERTHGADGTLWPVAESVVQRLVAGTTDDHVLTDLRALGVGYIWVTDASNELRVTIGNTPGIGTGTDATTGWVWPVPGSGRAVVVSGQDRTPLAPGQNVPPGDSTRMLDLGEPTDSRFVVTVGGTPLSRAALDADSYQLGSATGKLEWRLDAGTPWLVWAGWSALLLALIVAAPGVRSRQRESVEGRETVPRRAAGGVE